MDDGVVGGQQQHSGAGYPDQRLQPQAEEAARQPLPFAGTGPDDPVEHHEEGLPDEEIVVGQGIHQHSHGEQAAAPLLHILFYAEQQQGEPDHGLMKMIEKYIV